MNKKLLLLLIILSTTTHAECIDELIDCRINQSTCNSDLNECLVEISTQQEFFKTCNSDKNYWIGVYQNCNQTAHEEHLINVEFEKELISFTATIEALNTKLNNTTNAQEVYNESMENMRVSYIDNITILRARIQSATIEKDGISQRLGSCQETLKKKTLELHEGCANYPLKYDKYFRYYEGLSSEQKKALRLISSYDIIRTDSQLCDAFNIDPSNKAEIKRKNALLANMPDDLVKTEFEENKGSRGVRYVIVNVGRSCFDKFDDEINKKNEAYLSGHIMGMCESGLVLSIIFIAILAYYKRKHREGITE